MTADPFREPSFVASLRNDLTNVPLAVKQRMNSPFSLSEADVLRLVSRPEEPSLSHFQSPNEADFQQVIPHHAVVGRKEIESGRVAFCILAGGMGTRAHGPKALLRFSNGLSLLAIKLMQVPATCPIVIMVNPTTKDDISQHVLDLSTSAESIHAIVQYESYRLTADNRLLIVDGQHQLAPTGHGDLPFALLESGMLDSLEEAGVKYLYVTNVDNVLGIVDPELLLGAHLECDKPVTFQVTNRLPEDLGGGVVGWVDGKLQAVEAFRLSDVTNVSEEPWNSVNTFVVNTSAIRAATQRDWRWYRVRKVADSRLVVQHERLLQQLTEMYDTSFCVVPRERHYLPVKTLKDLSTARGIVFR